MSEAVRRRKSIGGFLPEPVADETIRELPGKAARVPSGGNLQPWRIYVLNGNAMARFRIPLAEKKPGSPEYEGYPPNLWEPYRGNRYQLAELMYEQLRVAREDKSARLAQLARNARFFDAPAALFGFIDRDMGPPADLGMFLQAFMLLAREAGIDTCPQEAWAPWREVVQAFVQTPREEMLSCGVAIGRADRPRPASALESPRMPLEQWARWVR